MTDIKAVYDKLPRQDRAADSQTLLQLLKGRPELVYAAISDDLCVWGWFPDGQPICLVNNEPYGQTRASGGSKPRQVSGRGTPNGIPLGAKAKLFQSFGVADLIVDPRRDIEPMLMKAGYDVDSPFAVGADVRTYRNLGPIDILFTNTHGGLGLKEGDPPDGNHFWPHYCLWTDEQIPALVDPDKMADLQYVKEAGGKPEQRPRLVRMLSEVSWIGFGIQHSSEWHYAITAEFVRKYMHFNENSFWLNNACHGTDPKPVFDTVGFQAACFEKGLSVYAGWDGASDRQQANASATFLFDRMSGANRYRPPTPPQRPFTWPSVFFKEMQETLHNDGILLLNEARGDAVKPIVLLKILRNPNVPDDKEVFGMLTPSIQNMDVTMGTDLKTHLLIAGAFGNKQGTVTIAGVDAPVEKWSTASVTCSLRAATEAGGHGDVIVKVDGHESNPAPLTMWEITFTDVSTTDWSGKYVEFPPTPPTNVTYYAEPTGSLTITAVVIVQVRADAHLARSEPGQNQPFPGAARSFTIIKTGTPTKDARISSISVVGSSQEVHSNDRDSTTWTNTNTFSLEGSPSVLLDGSDSRALPGEVYGSLDPVTRQMGLVCNVSADPVVHIDKGPNGGGMAPTGWGMSFQGVPRFNLGNDYNIQSGSTRNVNAVPSAGYTITTNTSWTSKVSSAPKEITPRSAKLR